MTRVIIIRLWTSALTLALLTTRSRFSPISTDSLIFLGGSGGRLALCTRTADPPITETDRQTDTPVAGSTGVSSRHEKQAAVT